MSWVRRHRVPEILCGVVINAVALAGNKLLPVHERSVPEIQFHVADASGSDMVYSARNPELEYPLVKEQLPMGIVTFMILGIPAVCLFLAARCVKVPKRFKRSIAVWWLQGHALNNFFTHTIKCFAGRPRPNFYALIEAGRASTARKSFPSGHTSSTATAMCMLSLLLLDMLPFHPRYTPHRARFFFARFLCVALPGIFTLWVGVTRTQDNYHNFSDVLGGLIIGTMCGLSSYYLEGVGNALTPGARMSTSSDWATGLDMLKRSNRSSSASSDRDDEPVTSLGSGIGFGIAGGRAMERTDDADFKPWPAPKPPLRGGASASRSDLRDGGPPASAFRSNSMFNRNRSGISHASIRSHGI